MRTFFMYAQGHKAIVDLDATMRLQPEAPEMKGIRFAVYRQTDDPDFMEMVEDNFFANATLESVISRWEKYLPVGSVEHKGEQP